MEKRKKKRDRGEQKKNKKKKSVGPNQGSNLGPLAYYVLSKFGTLSENHTARPSGRSTDPVAVTS